MTNSLETNNAIYGKQRETKYIGEAIKGKAEKKNKKMMETVSNLTSFHPPFT